MTTLRSLAFAATLLASPLGTAYAQDADSAVARARAAADAAHEQLVDRYRAVWSRLTSAQKAEFGSRERAWLNGGRAEQERALRGNATRGVDRPGYAGLPPRCDRAAPRDTPRNGDPGQRATLAQPAFVDHFHLIEQPMLGICSAGPCPVVAT